jgi:hypothetical protein
MLFLAQFDEIDEGTQFFKCLTEVPVGKSPFVGYEEGVGSDHYLKLAGNARSVLRASLSPTRIAISRKSVRDSRDPRAGAIRIVNMDGAAGIASPFQWIDSRQGIHDFAGRRIRIGVEAGNGKGRQP